MNINRGERGAAVRSRSISTANVGRTQNFNGRTQNFNGGGRTRAVAPTIALGGHSYGNAGRGGNYQRFAPSDVSHGWDHGHEHYWNNHAYRWHDNAWIIVDGGYDYGYPYYGYDYSDSPDYVTAPTTVVRRGGSVGADVQTALAQAGYYQGPVDGVVGPQTRNAIAGFQQDHGLAPTGNINGALLSDLGLQ